MPIYEFYCADCHTLFNFFSSGIDTESRPQCPACGKVRLERRPARFATLKHRGDDEPDPLGDLDDERLEGAMDSIMREFGDLGEGAAEDPRRLAQVFRRLSDTTGMQLGPQMEEMMRRLEAGENPEKLESEMEGLIDDDESIEDFFEVQRQAIRRARRRPRIDDNLYFL